MVGLSEINSKNYEIILDKIKCLSLTTAPDSSEPIHSGNVNNIKTEIKQYRNTRLASLHMNLLRNTDVIDIRLVST